MELSKSINETSERLGCSRRTVFKLLKQGQLERAEPTHTRKTGRPETKITIKSIISYINGGK